MSAFREVRTVLHAVLVLALSACATTVVDPTPRDGTGNHVFGLGLTGGVVIDEDDAESRFTTPGPMTGLDATWRNGFIGATQALHVHGEGRAVRVSSFTALNVHFLLEFGVGLRVGWLAGTPSRTRPQLAWALAFSVAIPLALSPDCTLVPYARPGFRILEKENGDVDLRGVHEFGVTLRWTFGRF